MSEGYLSLSRDQPLTLKCQFIRGFIFVLIVLVYWAGTKLFSWRVCRLSVGSTAVSHIWWLDLCGSVLVNGIIYYLTSLTSCGWSPNEICPFAWQKSQFDKRNIYDWCQLPVNLPCFTPALKRTKTGQRFFISSSLTVYWWNCIWHFLILFTLECYS